jgi:hypothetical protein
LVFSISNVNNHNLSCILQTYRHRMLKNVPDSSYYLSPSVKRARLNVEPLAHSIVFSCFLQSHACRMPWWSLPVCFSSYLSGYILSIQPFQTFRDLTRIYPTIWLISLSVYPFIYIRRPQGTTASAPEKQCQTESFSEGEERTSLKIFKPEDFWTWRYLKAFEGMESKKQQE